MPKSTHVKDEVIVVPSCVNCGVRYTCCNIKDNLVICSYWFYGNGYGSSYESSPTIPSSAAKNKL